jgi:hypothetical protein
MSVPEISALELMDYVRSIFPATKIVHEPINRDYGSWCITVGGKEEDRWLEVVWGPLSGFGGTDMKNLPGDDPDIFAPFEVAFDSLEDAKRWLADKK